MTGHRAATPLVGGVALLERAINYTLGSLHGVTPEALSLPTPCPGWDLRSLLAHLDDSLAALHEAIDIGRVGLEPNRTESADPIRDVRDRARRLLGVWANADAPGPIWIAGHPLAAEVVTSAGAIEVATHGWDIATACGRSRPIPPPLAEDLLPFLPLLVTAADRPARFAAPVHVAPPTTPGDRMIAFLGRHP